SSNGSLNILVRKTLIPAIPVNNVKCDDIAITAPTLGFLAYTKHMLRLRRAGEINGEHVPEIILLNSHAGTSSYQMLPGYFRFVCQNGCVCGQSLG
ncbi:hypothetical protein Q604_UNBC03454G0001, partial [human gut metagenome]